MGKLSGKSRQFIDITDLVIKYVQQFPFAKDIKSRLNLDDLKLVDIDFGYLRTIHKSTKHVPCTQHDDSHLGPLSHEMNGLSSIKSTTNVGKKLKSYVLFSSIFTNSTSKTQTNHLRTERRTHSMCRLSIQRGITRGGEFNLQIGPPNIALQANGSFKKEIHMAKECEQVFEEEMVWSLDTEVMVPPQTRTTAELIIAEDEYSGQFQIETVYEGRIVVKLRDKKDGSLVTVLTINDLSKLLSPEFGFQPLADQPGSVTFIHEGTCHCQFGINQKVDLTEEKL